MAKYTHVGPGLPPLHGARAIALILGSFPSPKSREQGFFYGHKQNRFWPMIAAVTGEPVPDWADIEAKKAIILKHGLAVWDTIGACDIKGASDASIRNAVPNDVAALIQKLGVRAVFCNGAASGRIYAKYAEPLTHLPAAVLPNVAGPGKLVFDYGDSAAYLIEAATAADLEAVAAKLEVLGGRLALVLKKLPE